MSNFFRCSTSLKKKKGLLMASRTYLPTLIALLRSVCNFITRHRDRLIEVVGTPNAPKLDAIVTACMLFTDVALPFLEPGD